MDAVGIEKTIILTGATGKSLTISIESMLSIPNRFDFWCDFDYTGYDQHGFGPASRTRTGEDAIRRAHVGLASFMIRGKASLRAR